MKKDILKIFEKRFGSSYAAILTSFIEIFWKKIN